MNPSLRIALSICNDWDTAVARVKAVFRAAPILLLALLACVGTLRGQATTSVRGAVVDPSGGAVSGATVTLTNTESKIERKIATGEDGAYQFSLLPPVNQH
jgi:Carboxypeptidase regulatory-like domain